jgi:CRISPR-associated protein Cas1
MENDMTTDPALLPARMLNEYAYCPRLFHIEVNEGLFEDNVHTVEGRAAHRRVDGREDPLPEAEDEAPKVARSVKLSSESLGLIATIDLLEVEDDLAVPVDTKKGKAPAVPEGAWEPERVQLCAQGLLLREHGHRCVHGYIYFAGSRRRVRIDFTQELVDRTLSLAAEARSVQGSDQAPPPLVDSPKCPGCSLVGICLPDEVGMLRSAAHPATSPRPPRRLVPARADRISVYVQGYGSRVSKRGEAIRLQGRDGSRSDVRLADMARLAIYGTSHVTTQALQALCRADVPVSWHTQSGWFYGVLRGHGLPNVHLRRAQFRLAEDRSFSLRVAKSFVAGKISNARTLLMRNHPEPPRATVDALKNHVRLAGESTDLAGLLGIEGNAARLYFGSFSGMIKERAGANGESFQFEKRNRRPPRDPVNALLSFAYSLLVRELTTCLYSVGLDPYVGFLHQPRAGRPALALDLMEEFRPLVADSVVLTLLNNGEATPGDFVTSRAGCAMKEPVRKRLIETYERRMDTLVTHPVFDYRVSYRRVLDIQARLLGRLLTNEIDEYPAFRTR